MEKIQFKLTAETLAIFPNTGKLGELQSGVVQNGQCHPIELSPKKLIEWNLAQVGFSLSSCREMAKNLLNTTSMFPVCLNYDFLIFFPTESMKNDTCAWIALHMVRDIIEISDTESYVFCYGHTDLIIPVSPCSLRKRWKNAIELHFKLQQTRQPQLFVYGEKRQELLLVRDGQRVRYEMR